MSRPQASGSAGAAGAAQAGSGQAGPGQAGAAQAGTVPAGAAAAGGEQATPPPAGGDGFRAVLSAAELPAGQVRRVVVDGRPIALWNTGAAILATDDTCTHEKASLSEGEFDPHAAQAACPRHGARFDLKTGKALTLPAYKPLRTYPVRVEGGQIQIRWA